MLKVFIFKLINRSICTELEYFRSLLKRYARARTIYDVHSPFVFRFLRFVTDASRSYYDFQHLDTWYWVYENLDANDSHVILEKHELDDIYRIILFLSPSSIVAQDFPQLLVRLFLLYPTKKREITLPLNKQIFKLPNSTKPTKANYRKLIQQGIRKTVNDTNPFEIENILFVHDLLKGKIDDQHIPVLKQCNYCLLLNPYNSIKTIRTFKNMKDVIRKKIFIDLKYCIVLIDNENVKQEINLTYIPYFIKPWRAGFFSPG